MQLASAEDQVRLFEKLETRSDLRHEEDYDTLDMHYMEDAVNVLSGELVDICLSDFGVTLRGGAESDYEMDEGNTNKC